MRFVHAADLHIDSPLRGLDRYEGAPVGAIRGATRRALRNLIDLCIARQADFLVLAGDVFDGDWRDMSTAPFFARELGRLRGPGIRVFTLRGNHDAASRLTRRLPPQEHVHEFATTAPETVHLEELGVALHGQGYAKARTTEDLVAAYPAACDGVFNIGVLHTALDGREGHDPYAPTTVEALRAKGYDYWALGHVHEREVVAEDPYIVFPGNLQGRHARELGAKGATVVEVEDGVVAIEHVPLDVVRWFAVDVDLGSAAGDGGAAAVDFDAVRLRVRGAIESVLADAGGRLAALRLTLSGAAPAHTEMQRERDFCVAELRLLAADVAEEAGSEGCWVEKVRIRTRPPIDVEALRRREDLVGDLMRTVDRLRADPESIHAMLPGGLDKKLRAERLDVLSLADATGLWSVLDDAERILLDALVVEQGDSEASG